eukprot:CAMPEP_0202443488 /NCGR_PEP_ID=MMETSP1360-20130828/2729_1 /ASSEMBLY_ACC=CAM_ASM_000848 /TAXON_ID=515479 /ORGANISM="Licmophora paradoxa, Strain CCMP2313" /LENGTH=51 /DNA_ID=CAMNT_0049059177 /DNA_START=117 /DNA_END=272 /DNA_ORIENTATION=+
MDAVSYGLGNSDELKGTGVWSFVEVKRDSEEDEGQKKPVVDDGKKENQPSQ